MKDTFLGQAWLVIVLGLCFGAGLAGVQASLKPRIDKNKLDDTLGQIPSLVPGAAGGEAETIAGDRVFKAVNDAGQIVGWVIPARGQGFADVIELLVGADKDANRITGLYILDQKETPGLGNLIVEAPWREQFNGKPTDKPLVVVKNPPTTDAEIEAVTGATISSASVVAIVNQAVARFRAALAQAY